MQRRSLELDEPERHPKTTSPEPINQSRNYTKFERFEFVISALNRLLIGFVTIYMSWICLRIGDWIEIPWHALFCTIGFLCLMSEGLCAHYHGNAWTQNCKRSNKTQTHWKLQITGAILGISGIIVKICLEENHFDTIHGKFGLCTLILSLWSLMTGVCSFYAHEMHNKLLKPIWNKAAHTIIGLTTYTLSILSIFSAFETDIFLEHSLESSYVEFRLILKLIVILIYILTSYGPIWGFFYSKLWKS